MSTTALTALPAAHQPLWASPQVLAEVCEELRRLPALVDADACDALRRELAQVALGESFVIQAGDCAELFADSRPDRIEAKANQLDELSEVVESAAALPVVRIGRFAGQYAKPRSCDTEVLPDGTVVDVYRGDAVNSPEPGQAARRPDANRLRSAYHHAAGALDALYLNRFLPIAPGADHAAQLSPTYVSHEALLLDFERALVRPDHHQGGSYGSSAHFVWIGDRTRQPRGAHLAHAASINNPVGVKVGPNAAPADIAALVRQLTTGQPAGRLSLIVRMGAGVVATALPAVIAALGAHARQVVWLCDPMHGNTKRLGGGQKTRAVEHVLAEVAEFFAVLRQHGLWPGGLHLEITPEPVRECVDTAGELDSVTVLPDYTSACDPRLNTAQAAEVVALAAELAVRR